MDSTFIMSIAKQAIVTAFYVAAPILGTALVVGVMVSIFQAATSISDSVLAFAPKVIVAGLALMLLGPWMLNKILSLMTYLIGNLPELIR
jgi:flagellar biosynthetic protein FliQ